MSCFAGQRFYSLIVQWPQHKATLPALGSVLMSTANGAALARWLLPDHLKISRRHGRAGSSCYVIATALLE